jgi:two-component system response regulator NreC
LPIVRRGDPPLSWTALDNAHTAASRDAAAAEVIQTPPRRIAAPLEAPNRLAWKRLHDDTRRCRRGSWRRDVPTRILLADDHLIVRQALKALLEGEGFAVVAEAGDGVEAVRVARERCPDVAILDLSMPLLNGLDAAREIQQVCPRAKAILLTIHTEDHYVLDALRAGIKGYVVKTQAAADLVRAISEVQKGMVYLSPGVSQTVVQAYLSKAEFPPDLLTPRERQVLQLVAEGKTTKQVAKLLGITQKTAESHRTRIMEKLEVHETASLVRYAVRRGLIQP